jgi:DNA-binding response OmpR family regulator
VLDELVGGGLSAEPAPELLPAPLGLLGHAPEMGHDELAEREAVQRLAQSADEEPARAKTRLPVHGPWECRAGDDVHRPDRHCEPRPLPRGPGSRATRSLHDDGTLVAPSGGARFFGAGLSVVVTHDGATLLLVEDDPVLRTFLADNLSADGYRLLVAETLRDGLRELEYKRPDLAIIDLGLPDGSGLELIGRVRSADGLVSRLDPAVPVVVLSGRSSEIDRVRGFERGADDFVVKPFSYAELRARLAAVLRRTSARPGQGRLRVGDLELDPVSREVRIRGHRIDLSQKEFALLRALAADPTRVWTKSELLRDVWGFKSLGTTRTLDSHACRLRHKLSAQGDKFVVNVWGVGYRLIDGPSQQAEGQSAGFAA